MKIRLDSQHRLKYRSTAFKVFHFIGKGLLFVFILFLLFVGFTQTSYFRNLLKNKIIEFASDNLNGNLNVESIYGTLFSSLTIKNLNYSIDGVEFVSAKNIHISLNPLTLIQNKIVINKIFLENVFLNFVQFKDSLWITEKILKHPIEKDTTPPSKFDYDIFIKSTTLSNCQFTLKRNVDSVDYYKFNYYKTINYDDIVVSRFNLQFSAKLLFPKNEFELKIRELSFVTNVENFSLNKFKLNFLAKERALSIQPLELKTFKSNLKLNLRIDEFDLSDPNLFENISQKKVNVLVNAYPFDFGDLYSLVPEVDMLNGKIFLQAEANGSLNELNVDYITAKYDSTYLHIQGVLQNLIEPENLYIKARVINSELLMKDVSSLLPLYGIPKFERLEKLKLEISHEGTPLNFITDFKIRTSQGEITGTSKFNFNRKIPNYLIDISTRNFDIKPFTEIDGILYSKLKVQGQGFDIETLNTELNFFAHNSYFLGNKIDSLALTAFSRKKNISLDLFSTAGQSKLILKSLLDFNAKDFPQYSIDFQLNNIDPHKNLFLKDYRGNLNIGGSLIGKSLNLDEVDAELNLSVYESSLNDYEIDKSNVLLKIDHSTSETKQIRIRSDFVDLDIIGNYKFSDVLKVFSEKVQAVQNEVNDKIKLFKDEKDTIVYAVLDKKTIKQKGKVEKQVEPNFDFKYKIKFKEFELINVILRNIKINLKGNIAGKIANNSEGFVFENQGVIDDFWVIDFDKSIRSKNTNFSISLMTASQDFSEKKLKLITKFKSEKIFTGSNFEDVEISLDYGSDIFRYEIQSIIDSLLSIRSEGTFDISSSIFKAAIDKATIVYKKYKLTNRGALKFTFSKDKVDFEQFVLRRKKELFKISGELGYWGTQNLKFTVEDLELYDLVLSFFPNITEEIGGELSLSVNLNGISEAPVLNGSINLKHFSIGSSQLGDFTGNIEYQNKKISVFASYVDTIYNGNDFELSGNIPVDLSFREVQERLLKDQKFEFNLTLNDFNLQPLRAIIPIFKNIEGSLNGGIRVTGTFDKPEFFGTITSKNMNFVLAQNNLKYSSEMKLNLRENKIILEKLELLNVNTRKRGRLFTNAIVEIDNQGIKYLKLTTTGSLLVLSQESRSVSPKLYGDFFIETSSPIVIEGKYNNYFVTGDVNIKETSLIIPPIQSEYSSEEEMFVYKYVDYSNQIDPADLAFMQAERELRGHKKTKAQTGSNVLSKIQGRIKISLKNNVSMTLIFNQELNQRLFADLKGELVYNFSEDQASTQGEIELTQDSYLVFYQRFLASGKIRFESELSNPYLDVTANYSNYYVIGDTVNQQVKDVLIKLHLVGRVTELGKNLVNNRENIEIYIDGNVDRSKDASDVVAFILLGKFKDDLTAEDKTGALSNWGVTFQSAAGSLLGSVVANFANSILGDVLRNVEFKKVGEETRFSFEGRVRDVRFKVGGGTDVFQNFALANIQIEYPVSEKLFLRLIRKPAQLQVSKSTEMINEVGLKYKVEF